MDSPGPAALLVVAVCAFAIGTVAIVAVRRPKRSTAALGIAAIAASTALQTLPLNPSGWDSALYVVGLPLVCVAYPQGRVGSRWIVVALIAAFGCAFAAIVTAGAVVSRPWWTIAMLGEMLFVIAAIRRYRRRSDSLEREQMRWAVLGLVLLFGTTIPLALLASIIGDGTIDSLGLFAEVAATVSIAAFPAALAVGLTGPRPGGRLDVDALLEATLSVMVAGWGLAAVFGLLLGSVRAAGATEAIVPWIAAGALAAAVIPLLSGARTLGGWLVHGIRPTPAIAAGRLQDRLAAISPLDDTTGAIEAEAATAIGSPRVRLEPVIDDEDRGGEDDAGALDGFTVAYRGVVLGVLRVAPRRAESALTRRDRRVIAAIIERAAPALHGSRAVSELVEARSALVQAREEERRRLRRDLHDDLAPTLAGLGLSVAAARELAPTALHRLLDDTQQGVREAIARTRTLAHGLRPPILDDRGLADAIRERSRLLESSGITPVLTIEDPGPLPAAVEAAALLIVQEAIANVVRHSSATRCEIGLHRDAGALTVLVGDDGIGLAGRRSTPTGTRAEGFGIASMRERSSELGGTTTFAPGPDRGTTVQVRLPLARIGEPR